MRITILMLPETNHILSFAGRILVYVKFLFIPKLTLVSFAYLLIPHLRQTGFL